ncbi:MAG: DUF4126 domain-containing protein [Chloroflexi bacterium]|nr:DUF4126 domain-containing protein [Chloroflexota bacterium]
MPQIVLSAMSAGGLVGISNQYMFLLCLSIISRLGWVDLTPEMQFMESWFFIIPTGIIWLITTAPAYLTTFDVTWISNVANTANEVFSGLLVPASSALVGLASVGIIASTSPELEAILAAFSVFNQETGSITPLGIGLAGGSAVIATTLRVSRTIAKPGVSVATGTTGTVDAPIFTTIENVISVVMVGLYVILSRINPWLVVALLAVVILITAAILTWAIFQLIKLGRGFGRVFRLLETHPKAGWALIGEVFAWGSGHLAWSYTNGAVVRIVAWAAYILFGLFVMLPLIVVPVIGIAVDIMYLILGIFIGLRSAAGLARKLERDGHIPPIGEEGVESNQAAAPAAG